MGQREVVGFIAMELQNADREIVVLQDPSLDGSLLLALTIDRGTQAVNGAPLEGSGRALITGDLVQLYQGALAARALP